MSGRMSRRQGLLAAALLAALLATLWAWQSGTGDDSDAKLVEGHVFKDMGVFMISIVSRKRCCITIYVGEQQQYTQQRYMIY